jgi:hypothetical protein
MQIIALYTIPINTTVHWLYGAFAKQRKGIISFVMYVCQYVCVSVRPEGTTAISTGRILMKLDIISIFPKSVEKIQFSLKSDKNNGYFANIPVNIFNHISLSHSWNENVSHESCRQNQNTHIMFNQGFFSNIVPFII